MKGVLLQVGIIAGSYFTYMFVRRFLIPDVETIAYENSLKVISFEWAAGFFWEQAWQAWAIEHSRALVVALNWLYVFTFVPILATTTLLVYVKDPGKYFYYRNVWLLSFLFALVLFALFPLAPPRFLPEYGFVDAIQDYGPAWYGGRDMVKAIYFNVYAAMPSLHFGWTVLFGILYFRTGRPWLRVIGVLYPVMTLFAITLTGNHFVMDAAGGIAVVLAPYLLYEGILKLRRSRLPGLVKERLPAPLYASLRDYPIRTRDSTLVYVAALKARLSPYRSPTGKWKGGFGGSFDGD